MKVNNLNLISEQWAQILKSRGSWRTMNIENLEMSYWDMAMGHTEEYMLKYENDDMDIEGITYRIDVLNSFIDEYEKYFNDYEKMSKLQRLLDKDSNEISEDFTDLVARSLRLDYNIKNSFGNHLP